MKKKQQLTVLIVITVSIIVLAIGYQTIGRAIAFPTDDELIAKIKDLIDNSPAKEIQNLDACIIIQIQDEKLPFDVQRKDGVTTVTKSEYDCRGQAGEDFVIKFLHYSSFLKFTRDPSNCDLWVKGGDGTYFYWLPSKAINPGFTANCDKRLCPAITSCINESENLTQMGLECCV